MNTKIKMPKINPKTVENLKENYRRENISSGKYGIYAQKLQAAGYESLANLFYACSHSEIIHAARHSRVALLLGIKLETDIVRCEAESVEDILADMIREEQDAMADYPRFLKDAEEEEYTSAVLTMSASMKADRTHYDYCVDAAESGDYWKEKNLRFFTCALCGYVHERARIYCPVCGAKPEMFLPFPDDGHFDRDLLVFGEKKEKRPAALPAINDVWCYENVFPTLLITTVDFTTTITNTLENSGWPEEEIYAIVLSVTEAAVNANEHGNKGAADKNVYVECSISDDMFFCSMQDEGEGFSPQDVPDPCQDENLFVTHGRGLKLIDNFMSNVWFNGKGNKIFMVKTRG